MLSLAYDPKEQNDNIIPSMDNNSVINLEAGKIKYSPNGTVTILEDGFYRITYEVSFINIYDDNTPFNGDTGSFHTWLT